MTRKLLFLLIVVLPSILSAQDKETPFTFSGYLDLYYGYDVNKPINNSRPDFIYSYNRANEITVNLAYVKMAYATTRVRANIALMTGTYANANLASEPGVLKNIFEANVGVKISAKKNMWIDAGIFPSHIGFESAIGKDCWNVTRSMLADNTPYYESGVKLTYSSDNDHWLFSALLLNGWQKIQRIDGSTSPSFGSQVTFKPSEKITLNSSSFIGTNSPDSARLMRYFHNFYGIFQVSKRVGIIAGFDCGIQNQEPRGHFNSWYSPVIIARAALNEIFTIAVRGEYYADPHGVIIRTTTPNGFKTTGYSANLDCKISDNAVWRIEARALKSKDQVFTRDHTRASDDVFFTTSLAVSF